MPRAEDSVRVLENGLIVGATKHREVRLGLL